MRRLLGKYWNSFWLLGAVIATLLLALRGEAAWAGRPIKVVIIDTGIDLGDKRFNFCDSGSMDFTGKGIADTEEHATHVAGIITAMVEGSQKVCLAVCRFYDTKAPGVVNLAHETACFKWAKVQHADFVNLSGGGGEFSEDEYRSVKALMASGTKVIVAAGNEHSDVDKPENYYYPGSYRISGVTMVGSLEPSGLRAMGSNWGVKSVAVYAPGDTIYSTLPHGDYGYMSGTSMATAVETGAQIRQRLRLPVIPYNLSLWKHLRRYWSR